MRAPAARNQSSALILIIGFVCIGIFMQMLGTTMTLWDLSYQLDPDKAPLLEGFSLPAQSVGIQNHAVVRWRMEAVCALHPVLAQQSLFRPPNLLA